MEVVGVSDAANQVGEHALAKLAVLFTLEGRLELKGPREALLEGLGDLGDLLSDVGRGVFLPRRAGREDDVELKGPSNVLSTICTLPLPGLCSMR